MSLFLHHQYLKLIKQKDADKNDINRIGLYEMVIEEYVWAGKKNVTFSRYLLYSYQYKFCDIINGYWWIKNNQHLWTFSGNWWLSARQNPILSINFSGNDLYEGHIYFNPLILYPFIRNTLKESTASAKDIF